MNEDTFEKIDKYLNGKMSPGEQLLFQAEIASNQVLSSAVNIYSVIEKEMAQNEKDYDEELLLRNTLGELNSRHFKNETPEGLFEEENRDAGSLKLKETIIINKGKAGEPGSFSKVRKMNPASILAVAVSIIGIIALGIEWYLQKAHGSRVSVANKITPGAKKTNTSDTFLLNKNSQVNNVVQKDQGEIKTDKDEADRGTLYAVYFKPDAPPEDKEGVLRDAFTHYENKKYAEAITAINHADLTIVTRGEESDQEVTAFNARYYKAQSYMALNNIKNAIAELDSATINSPDHLSEIKAKWYLALAHLKEGNFKKTLKLLKQIAYNNEASVYRVKAQKLAGKMKQLK